MAALRFFQALVLKCADFESGEAMLYSRVLAGFLAVGLAAAGQTQSSVYIYESAKRVHLAVWAHGPASGAGTSRDLEAGTVSKSEFVEKICSDSVPSQDTFLQRWGVNQVEHSVKFTAYYRTPPPSGHDPRGLADVVMDLRLAHAPQTSLAWGESLQGNHFKYSGHRRGPENLEIPEYSITSKPGSVFPIVLVAPNFQPDKFFCMLLINTLPNSFEGRREAQLVTFKEAVMQKIRPRELTTPPPVLQLLHDSMGHLLLSRPMSRDDVLKFAEMTPGDEQFIVTGYFRPSHTMTKIVLSSTMLVGVQIYVPTLPKDKEYMLYTLTTDEGEACEMILPTDPNLLYKVAIVGTYRMLAYFDFTLMLHDPDNHYISSGVDLLIPSSENRQPKHVTGAMNGTFEVADLIDFDSDLD